MCYDSSDDETDSSSKTTLEQTKGTEKNKSEDPPPTEQHEESTQQQSDGAEQSQEVSLDTPTSEDGSNIVEGVDTLSLSNSSTTNVQQGRDSRKPVPKSSGQTRGRQSHQSSKIARTSTATNTAGVVKHQSQPPSSESR